MYIIRPPATTLVGIVARTFASLKKSRSDSYFHDTNFTIRRSFVKYFLIPCNKSRLTLGSSASFSLYSSHSSQTSSCKFFAHNHVPPLSPSNLSSSRCTYRDDPPSIIFDDQHHFRSSPLLHIPKFIVDFERFGFVGKHATGKKMIEKID
jgi:hypothetical protein